VPPSPCGSLTFLHAISGGAPTSLQVATYRVRYEDGEERSIPIRSGIEVANWWDARNSLLAIVDRNRFLTAARVAWRGSNPQWKNVGLYAMPWNNPHPEKRVESVEIECLPACPHAALMVAAITSSDRPAPRNEVQSHGIPGIWSCASLITALVEGVAGVKDLGTAFSGTVEISPRWTATSCDQADVCIHYPASGGYVAYTLDWQRDKDRLLLDISGSLGGARLRILLPPETRPARVVSGEREWPFEVTRIESSRYLELKLSAPPTAPIEVLLATEEQPTNPNPRPSS
jgi:hypothetical protein